MWPRPDLARVCRVPAHTPARLTPLVAYEEVVEVGCVKLCQQLPKRR